MKMVQEEKATLGMVVIAIFFAVLTQVAGVCEDDLVPLDVGQLPAVWDVGTLPFVFLNSVHMRGVASVSGYKVLGLDTVNTTSLYFCPPDMTIYGNLSVAHWHNFGDYSTLINYISHGSHIYGHGGGFLNMTFKNIQLRNLVAPIRYSTKLKRLQIEVMQYEIIDELVSPVATGFEIDDKGGYIPSADEMKNMDQTSACPSAIESARAILNAKVKKGILLGAVKQMFASVFSV